MRDDGTIAGWNDVAERTFGWTFAEVDGRNLSEVIVPPELQLSHDAGLKRYLSTGVATMLGRHIEVTAMDRNGRRFPVELSATELNDGTERIFVGFVRDIGERKDVERRLRDVTERLELAVRVHCIGIFDTNPVTGQVHWSSQLEEIFGYAAGEFSPTLAAWRSHVSSKELKRIEKQFEKAHRRQAAETTYSYRMTRCDGEVRDIEASVRFFYDSAGNNVRRVGVNIDVTERKAVARRLLETQDELIHVSRLNSLGAVASSFGHELNQPLSAISNYIAASMTLMQAEQAQVEPAMKALELAGTATKRAGELVKRLRSLASKGAIKLEKIDLNDVLEDTALIALNDASLNGITLRTEIQPDMGEVCADPVLLQQVIFNLVRNAGQALSSTTGAIIVRASLASVDRVIVEVVDTGPGIDQRVMSHLFSAFTTTKSEGMGVGLAIYRTIVEKWGGKIYAESSDSGSCFSFTIPRV